MTANPPERSPESQPRLMPLLLRCALLGAIVAASLGTLSAVIECMRYGFYSKPQTLEYWIWEESFFVFCLAVIGMILGVFLGLVFRAILGHPPTRHDR